MSNLLDKASIILTPTAYNNGEALCVKPSDGSGDFDFSRNSAATRVNAQGLVENVQILSSNLVQNPSFSEEGVQEVSNGSFTNGSTDWSLGTGWSIAEDKAVFIGSSSGEYLVQNNVYTLNSSIKLTFDVLDYVSGSVRIIGGGTVWASGAVSSNGTHTFYINTSGAVNNNIYVQAISGNFDGSITNISVKEVGQNWDLLNGTITDKYNASLTSYQNGIRVNPFTYTGTVKVTFDLVVTSGSCKFVAGGSNEQIYSTSGTKEIIVTNPSRFEFNAFNLGWVGTLDNVSAIQITDDTNLPRISYENFSYQDVLGSELVVNGGFDSDTAWTKGSGWAIANGVATHTGGASYLSQSILNADTQYKVNISVTAVSGGGFVQIYMGNSPASVTISTIGDYTYYFTSQSLQTLGFALRSLGDVTIDNVSVKEYSGQEVVPDSGCGSWLWEPQSTNLITQSNDLSQWFIQQNAIVSSPTFVSPSGENNANLIDLSADTDARVVLNFGSASTEYTFSVYLKKHESDVNGTFPLAYYNGSNYIKTYVNLTDKWQRFSLTFTNPSGSVFGYGLSRKGTTSDETLTRCYAWGGQQEALSYPTSLIPTDGSSVTRNQDLCTNGGSLASINSTEGTLYFEAASFVNSGTDRAISLFKDNPNTVSVFYYAAINTIRAVIIDNGGTKVALDVVLTDVTDFNKIALKYKENDVALWVNGIEMGTDTNCTIPTGLNSVDFKYANSPFFGKTKALAVFPYLTDQELTELTTI